ncbi:MAG: diguanylate cyclase, partial [Gammaproteobacteria bacterium]|nr:diguanylate cyclase [Gammaproteobacteria bacterium]
GKEGVRFDETRNDEFGYLGKFINDAIDTILKHKNDLELALERASAYEIELTIEKEHADVTLSSITDTVVTVDVDERIVYINPAGEKLLGNESSSFYGKPFKEVFNIANENAISLETDPLHDCFVTGDIIYLSEQSSLILNDNDFISIEASIAPMKSSTGDLLGAVIVIQDVTYMRLLTKKLSYHASHDLLTGLYNRRKFEEYLSEILVSVKTGDGHHSLLYLDLDNFKIVNDSCGHVAGDELLKQIPILFDEIFRSGDFVARLGGDEFGIILENCNIDKAVKIADKVRQKIKDYRFIWDERSFEIGVSIGVIAIDSENTEISQILSVADMACYAAKDSGRNRVHVYDSSDSADDERYGQRHWTAKISKALEENRFKIYQQPIVCIADNNRDHLEILLRMVDEDDKLISPGAFMPAAERYGLMPVIDRWVIHETFKYIGRMNADVPVKGTDRVFAINLSGDSINDNALLDYILEEK